MHTVALYITET